MSNIKNGDSVFILDKNVFLPDFTKTYKVKDILSDKVVIDTGFKMDIMVSMDDVLTLDKYIEYKQQKDSYDSAMAQYNELMKKIEAIKSKTKIKF